MSSGKTLKKTADIKTELISSEWSQEAIMKLLERIEMNITKPDVAKFSSLVDKLAWTKVAFNDFTADDCKRKWNLLSKEIRKYRTLTEMVVDAQEYIKDPFKGQIKKHPDYPKRPLTPYFQYFMEKRDQFASKHPKMSNLEVTAELSKKYRGLSAKKKEKYTKNWQKETVVFRIAMKKFKEEHPEYFKTRSTRPKPARTPATIFKTECLEEYTSSHPKLSKKDCLEALGNKYKGLSDEIKQTYIAKALKEQEENMADLQKYLEMNPNVSKTMGKVVLTKKEQKLKDQLNGKPQKPPSNGYNLFCTEMMPTLTGVVGQKRIVECGRLWHLKSEHEKTSYQVRYMQMKQKYEEDYSVYIKNLSPEEQVIEQELSKKKRKNIQTTNAISHKPTTVKQEKISSDEEELSLNDSSSDASDDSFAEGGDESSSESNSSDEDEQANYEKKQENSEEEIINNAVSKLPIPTRPTTPFSALFLHQRANRKKVEKQYPNLSADEVTRMLARRYHELPEHKRHKYLLKEKEQKAIYNDKMQQYLKNVQKVCRTDNGEKPTQLEPVTGEQLYHEKKLAAFTKKFKNDTEKIEHALRDSWSKLGKAKKQPFITAAQAQNEANIVNYQEAVNKGIQEVPAVDKTTIVAVAPSKKKLKFPNEPKKPPASGYQLFNSTHLKKLSHLSQKEKAAEMRRLWQQLDQKSKQSFTNEAKNMGIRYKREVKKFIQTLPADMAAQYKLQKNIQSTEQPATKKFKVAEPEKVFEEEKEEEDSEESSSDDDSDSDSSDSNNESNSSSSDDEASSSSNEE